MIGRLGLCLLCKPACSEEKVPEELLCLYSDGEMHNYYMAEQTNKRSSRTTFVGYYGTQRSGGLSL